MLFVTYDPIEYWVLIPKIIEIFLFVIIAFKILRLKDYIVNKLYFAGFLVWAAYIAINSVIYLFAANNQTSFLIATILHKIALSCAIIFTLLLYISTLVIKDSQVAFKQAPVIVGTMCGVILCIVVILTQNIVVVDQNGTQLVTEAEWGASELVRIAMPINLLTSFLMVVPLFFCGFAIYFLTKIMKNNISDEDMKKKMTLLLWGIAFIPIGMIYFIIIQFLMIVNIATGTIGHLIWTLSPVLIWKSRK